MLVKRRIAQIGDDWCELIGKLLGTGSNAHCFVGAVLSTFMTSSDVTGSKCDSGSDTERLVMTGAGAPGVDARICSTLLISYHNQA